MIWKTNTSPSSSQDLPYNFLLLLSMEFRKWINTKVPSMSDLWLDKFVVNHAHLFTRVNLSNSTIFMSSKSTQLKISRVQKWDVARTIWSEIMKPKNCNWLQMKHKGSVVTVVKFHGEAGVIEKISISKRVISLLELIFGLVFFNSWREVLHENGGNASFKLSKAMPPNSRILGLKNDRELGNRNLM